MSELPEGWSYATLDDVAIWASGGTPDRKRPEYYNGSIPWVKTGELGQGLITDTEEKITELGLQNSSAKLFPKGAVVVAMYGATVGRTAVLGVAAATN
jgi:type I restriction enzyme, S subunit